MDLSINDFSLNEDVTYSSGSSSSNSPVRVLKKNQLTALESLAGILLREIESLKRTEESAHHEIAEGVAVNLYDEVQNFEASLIRSALIRAKGVQRKAAELLGVKVTTLNVKIKRYKITFEQPE
ncbi:MAG TPA: helix-turn-helix domain-containing protein [Pyrinomonadaceae bacterium]|nr:helix-turn-helix domain-containing protein [Pyrinomonadaceae bacterium]